MNALDIIKHLSLEPHPSEGGFFKRTYESDMTQTVSHSKRKLLTSIFYLLSQDSPIGYFHKNRSDIIHYYHMGSPIKYILVSSEGYITEHVLGNNLEQGEVLQLLVKGGTWKASHLCNGEYGLISEAVSPGFEYADNELATVTQFKTLFPNVNPNLLQYIKHEHR